MPEITFLPSGKSCTVPAGTDILSAARIAEATIDVPCGGNGTCGKCAVYVRKGTLSKSDRCVRSNVPYDENLVLACKSLVGESPVTIEIPAHSENSAGQFSDDSSANDLIDPSLFPVASQLTQKAFTVNLNVDPPFAGDGLSDCDRLLNAFKKNGYNSVSIPLIILRTIAETLRASNGQLSCTLIYSNQKNYTVIDMQPDHSENSLYGLAIDIGTTTVAVHCVRLSDKAIITTHTEYNGQIACGLDVISRINYAGRTNGLIELQTRILSTLNSIISIICQKFDINKTDIVDVSISGNTTMTHLLLALNPEYIRLDPYTPTVHDVETIVASDINLDINQFARIQIAPSVGSYVGGDITSGLLCTPIAQGREDLCLFIDIGTNGEIVVGNNEFLLTCACSAGPAFEGGGISCGMRAATGAIDNVTIDSETHTISFSTIGNAPALGICGSGMIMLIASLFRTGMIDMAGKFVREKTEHLLTINNRQVQMNIVGKDKSGTGQPIFISELDIDNIIRTKAAIFSACALMLNHVGLTFDDLSTIYIAGGFGRYLNIKDAITIGMLPDLDESRFRYIGNSSLAGSYMTLVSDTHVLLRSDIAKRMTYLDLSTETDYMNQYTAALFLPHTNSSLFPSVSGRKISQLANG